MQAQQCCLVHARRWRQRKLENNLRLYSWLSETYERERIADLREVVYRAIVNISPDRFVYVVFSPNRPIGESNLSSHEHLAAGLAHLPHCGGYAVRIVEIERRNPRGKWLYLKASIEGAEHLGSDRLNVD